jgi:hypothetical protein
MVNGKMTEWFDVLVGVRQGCLLSPCLFNLYLEFVMKEIYNIESGIQMGDMCINNLRYADDTTLMEQEFEKLQITTNELGKACSRWGMKINPKKCKIMTEDPRDITLDQMPIDKVENFVFLGSDVPSTEADVKRRTRLAASAFGRLKGSIWSNHSINRQLKVRIYQSLILPIAIYGSESWTLRKSDCQKLEAFEMRCLRSILSVSLLDNMKNDDIKQQLNIKNNITQMITKRRLKWFGHVIRMSQDRLPQQAYKKDFTQPRKPGTPPSRWRDLIPKDSGLALQDAENQAMGRPLWRRTTRRSAKGHTVLCS